MATYSIARATPKGPASDDGHLAVSHIGLELGADGDGFVARGSGSDSGDSAIPHPRRGYTRFTAEHGDEAASRLAIKFAEVATEGVEAWGGELVEVRGDEALAVFDSVRGALRAAVKTYSFDPCPTLEQLQSGG